MTHATSRFLALGAMLVMLILYGLTNLGSMGPNPIGTTSTATNPLIVPAGWAFAIWGPIYTLLIVFPIYQFIKKRDNHPAWISLRQWYAANVVANGVWLVFASYDWQWLTVVVIAFMLLSLFRINQLLRQLTAASADYSYWLERLVFSIYFAWVTLATVLNVSTALHFYGWRGGPMSEVAWTVVMSVVAAGIAGYTSWKFKDGAYALVPVWAFAAIAVRHWAGTQVLGVVALALAVSFVVVAGLNFRRNYSSSSLAAT